MIKNQVSIKFGYSFVQHHFADVNIKFSIMIQLQKKPDIFMLGMVCSEGLLVLNYLGCLHRT